MVVVVVVVAAVVGGGCGAGSGIGGGCTSGSGGGDTAAAVAVAVEWWWQWQWQQEEEQNPRLWQSLIVVGHVSYRKNGKPQESRALHLSCVLRLSLSLLELVALLEDSGVDLLLPRL